LLNVNDVDVHIGPSTVRYMPSKDVHFWMAPMMYLGNRVRSGTFFCLNNLSKFHTSFVSDHFILSKRAELCSGACVSILYVRVHVRHQSLVINGFVQWA
jgi:hypothetical protein